MYIAIWSKDLYPFDIENNLDPGIINVECETLKEANKILQDALKNDPLNFWNPQIYDKGKEEYLNPFEKGKRSKR